MSDKGGCAVRHMPRLVTDDMSVLREAAIQATGQRRLRESPPRSTRHVNGHQARHVSDGTTALVRHTPRLVTDDMSVLREAAIRAVGVVQLPTMMIWADEQAGRLVRVLKQWTPRSGVIYAVFPSRRGLPFRRCARSSISWPPNAPRGGRRTTTRRSPGPRSFFSRSPALLTPLLITVKTPSTG